MRRLAMTLAVAALSLAFAPAPFPKGAPRGRCETPGETRSAKEVMLWLIGETGKGVGSLRYFGGTVTFPGPKGTRYSPSDVVGILNKHLMLRGWVLIERESNFVVIDAEDLPAWR
jgi:hypothetical protein